MIQLPLILASASPRRQEMLRAAGIEFLIRPSHISEDMRPGESPLAYALRVAQEKAETVARQFPEHVILGADTIVVVEQESLGKPQDKTGAAQMLRRLSGRGHEVTTAVCIIAPGRSPDTRSLTTRVIFRELSESEIQEYVAGGEPMDKAGAYAIQGGAASWVMRVEGDYANVVGLPMTLVTQMLRACGFLQS